MNPIQRIKKEIDDIRRDTSSGVLISQDEANPSHLTGTITGPPDTPYAGGTFHVDITIPGDYPFSPPKMKFTTKIWHPNVSSVTGAICLDILKDQWSPALTMKTALMSLQALMCAPEPNDPQDAEVATMYKNNLDRFNSTASFWTECHACPTPASAPADGPAAAAAAAATAPRAMHPAMRRLLDMGFEEVNAREALLRNKCNEEAAVEELLASLG